MLKVVVDTNVIISALVFGRIPDEIIRLARSRKIELYLSDFILQETARILKIKFLWSPIEMSNALRLLQACASVITPAQKLSVITNDDSDNRILECAVEIDANFLISGDRKHVLPLKKYKKVHIVNPAEFMRLWQMNYSKQ